MMLALTKGGGSGDEETAWHSSCVLEVVETRLADVVEGTERGTMNQDASGLSYCMD